MLFYVKNKNRKTAYTSLFIALSLVVIIGWASYQKPAFAQSSVDSVRYIPLSASLFDNKNRIISRGTHEVRFALYSVDRAKADPYPSTNDGILWQETQTVNVKNGVFRVSLGSKSPFPASINFESGNYYIGLRLDKDSEMVPRKQIGSVPRAYNSQYLQGRAVGVEAGNIPVLDENGKLSVSSLPVGNSSSSSADLLTTDNSLLDDLHQQNTDTGTTEKVFTIGSKTNIGSNNFDLSVSKSGDAPTLRYNGSAQTWQLSNNGTTFADISSGGPIDLGTDTNGDYVASITDGNGITGGLTGEGSVPTLAIDLLDSTDSAGVVSSNSGLEFGGAGSDELTLLQGCANGQALGWNDTTNIWECTSFSAGLSGSGTSGQVAYWSGASSLSGENQLNVSRGGTGVNGASAANGSLLIGNGSGYTLALSPKELVSRSLMVVALSP